MLAASSNRTRDCDVQEMVHALRQNQRTTMTLWTLSTGLPAGLHANKDHFYENLRITT